MFRDVHVRQSARADYLRWGAHVEPKKLTADLAKLGAELKAKYTSFKVRRDDVAQVLRDTRERMAELEGEAAAINAAPCRREDFIEALCGQVSRFADQGRARVKKIATTRIAAEAKGSFANNAVMQSQPLLPTDWLAWSRVREAVQGGEDFGSIGLGIILAGDHRNFNPGVLDFISICTLFEAQILGVVKKNMESFDWPFPQAEPTGQRLARLAEIEKELLSLEATEIELLGLLSETKAQ